MRLSTDAAMGHGRPVARREVNHDAVPGLLTRCQVCGSDDLREVIDLGYQPLCDALLTTLDEPETTYPLRLNQCGRCSLAQLSYVVPASEVYPAAYPYRAGISWPVVEAHKRMAADLVERYGRGFVVDIGCNDGTLLKQFQSIGCLVLGVEPTDIAIEADAAGVPTYRTFFSELLALELRSNGMQHGADIVTLTNVFAHMADLGEVMRGICALLARDGVLVVENHYLLDILERNQFDSIYHEHIRTYTLRSLCMLFEQYGMEVFDVQRMPRYGGNIRVHVGWAGRRPIDASVGELLRAERAAGVDDGRAWVQFRLRVNDARLQFMNFLRSSEVAGCSAPGRASTLLNYFGVRRDHMVWTGELDGSLKIGKYLPGCHIPVVSNRRLVEEQPEAIILLAWHYAAEIAARLRREGVKSRLYAPLPHFREVTQ